MEIMFFNNGNTVAFDDDGAQIPDLQDPWIIVFAEHLKSKGVDPTKIRYGMQDCEEATVFQVAEGAAMLDKTPGYRHRIVRHV